MRQSTKNTHRDNTIAAYLRISREDDKQDESYSITNQKKLLTDVAKQMGFSKILYFIDDGITGTRRDRKDFNRMLEELDKGHIGAVIVKDLSRLARDHILSDTLIEETFPEKDIRVIAIAEAYDSNNGEDEFIPFRSLLNEMYSRDISKKCKLSNTVRGNAGEPLSQPSYGYIKDPDNPKRWIVEIEAAEVVQRIYDLTFEGYGTSQISGMLSDDEVLSPAHYWYSKGISKPINGTSDEPCKWNASTIVSILSKQEYCGDVINFKTFSKSFKLKKRMRNTKENMAIFKDVHEPIIEREKWELIQERRSNRRKRKTKHGEKNMFSGLLICADCGKNLQYHFNQANPDIKYFNCSGYNTTHKTCSSTHYIRVDFLEKVILQEIKRLTRYARQYEKEFAAIIMGYHEQSTIHQREQQQKELASMNRRNREIDKLYSKMYEDNVTGKIDDERFFRMSKQYTFEQKELAEKIEALGSELEAAEEKALTAEMFISSVRKYTRVKKLSERMLNELIEKIEVHHKEKVDGVWQQKLTIHYNFIGAIEMPELLLLPEIVTKTRKGVQINYTPLQKAV